MHGRCTNNFKWPRPTLKENFTRGVCAVGCNHRPGKTGSMMKGSSGRLLVVYTAGPFSIQTHKDESTKCACVGRGSTSSGELQGATRVILRTAEGIYIPPLPGGSERYDRICNKKDYGNKIK